LNETNGTTPREKKKQSFKIPEVKPTWQGQIHPRPSGYDILFSLILFFVCLSTKQQTGRVSALIGRSKMVVVILLAIRVGFS